MPKFEMRVVLGLMPSLAVVPFKHKDLFFSFLIRLITTIKAISAKHHLVWTA